MASPRPRARLVVRANERGPLELPGGAWWLPGLASAAAADEVVYGQQGRWVINRPSLRVGQQGLVVRSTPPKPQRYAQAAPLSAPLVPVPPSPPAGGLTLSVRGIAAGTVVIDTDFEVLAVPEEPPTSAPMGSCVGIVPWGTTAEAEPPVAGSSKHPRRTLVVSQRPAVVLGLSPSFAVAAVVPFRRALKAGSCCCFADESHAASAALTSHRPACLPMQVRFTCNLCHTVTASYVNPHAWHTGSVFCRCSGCTAGAQQAPHCLPYTAPHPARCLRR